MKNLSKLVAVAALASSLVGCGYDSEIVLVGSQAVVHGEALPVKLMPRLESLCENGLDYTVEFKEKTSKNFNHAQLKKLIPTVDTRLTVNYTCKTASDGTIKGSTHFVPLIRKGSPDLLFLANTEFDTLTYSEQSISRPSAINKDSKTVRQTIVMGELTTETMNTVDQSTDILKNIDKPEILPSLTRIEENLPNSAIAHILNEAIEAITANVEKQLAKRA
ncbi:hypothetical protein EIJ81_00195 (plasmid) [Aliivibrio salmonicida]|uniref:hypothetical protein n=1 Tax=Aliivibrio salmonicida TaxID=40269 RepID=UPI000F6C2053|nr:hypothetical protein [Aliivibrio salmonicida]AZL83324.1 hypothetical protein EIJ81_00195 [Aliivibrio salmonicida]